MLIIWSTVSTRLRAGTTEWANTDSGKLGLAFPTSWSRNPPAGLRVCQQATIGNSDVITLGGFALYPVVLESGDSSIAIVQIKEVIQPEKRPQSAQVLVQEYFCGATHKVYQMPMIHPSPTLALKLIALKVRHLSTSCVLHTYIIGIGHSMCSFNLSRLC